MRVLAVEPNTYRRSAQNFRGASNQLQNFSSKQQSAKKTTENEDVRFKHECREILKVSGELFLLGSSFAAGLLVHKHRLEKKKAAAEAMKKVLSYR